MSADTAHFLAKTGHLALAHCECRLGRDIARRRPRTAGGQHQMAAGLIHQFDQGGLNLAALVGDETRFNLERFGQRAPKPFLKRRDPLVLIDPLRSTIAD